jgi:hypothetical protein
MFFYHSAKIDKRKRKEKQANKQTNLIRFVSAHTGISAFLDCNVLIKNLRKFWF